MIGSVTISQMTGGARALALTPGGARGAATTSGRHETRIAWRRGQTISAEVRTGSFGDTGMGAAVQQSRCPWAGCGLSGSLSNDPASCRQMMLVGPTDWAT